MACIRAGGNPRGVAGAHLRIRLGGAGDLCRESSEREVDLPQNRNRGHQCCPWALAPRGGRQLGVNGGRGQPTPERTDLVS